MSTTMVSDSSLLDFAKENNIEGLTEESLVRIKSKEEGYTLDRAHEFLKFQGRINEEVLKHQIILDNKFSTWFAKGELNETQVKEFVVQFSVFSNLFLIAQIKKMINADSLEGMRASKEILANEIGVIFNSGSQTSMPSNVSDTDKEGDPDLVSTEGTVDGGIFRYRAAHFEWLVRMGSKLNIGFNDMGKRRHGTKSTLFFCDELERLYGSDDYEISQAASYAVENWAAAGFWKDLISGFTAFKNAHCPSLPLAFFTWHDKIEDQHAAHTQEELEEYFFEHDFDENKFVKYANEMLEGVAEFWNGLEEQRKTLA